MKQGVTSLAEYEIFESNISKLIKNLKNNYYRNKYGASIGDSRKTWKITKDILGLNGGRKASSLSILHGSNLITNETQICNLFNDCFVNLWTNLAGGLDTNTGEPMRFKY